eukprot:1066638_1
MSNTIYYCKQTMNVTIDMNACDKSKAEIVALREQHQSVLSKWSAKHHTVLQSILTECDEYTAICATFNECKQRLVTSETQYQSLLRQYTCVLKDFKTGEMVHKDASRDCKCTEYKEPIPMNRPLPTGHYMSQAQEHIEMVLFKNPNYCFDEDSLLLLFGVILKEFGCMSKDYKLKQCLLTVDAAKQCLISMGTGSGAQCIVLQQLMQSIISSLMLIKNGKLSNQQLLRKIMPQSNRQCKKVCLTSVS